MCNKDRVAKENVYRGECVQVLMIFKARGEAVCHNIRHRDHNISVSIRGNWFMLAFMERR